MPRITITQEQHDEFERLLIGRLPVLVPTKEIRERLYSFLKLVKDVLSEMIEQPLTQESDGV
jgi:hypothetical protein